MIHIVTPFPSLLVYSFFVPTMLRLVLGIFIIMRTTFKERVDGVESPNPVNSLVLVVRIINAVAALFIIIGLYTQIAAILLSLHFIISFFRPRLFFQHELSRAELILILAISISLIFSGAGAFAIDYPL